MAVWIVRLGEGFRGKLRSMGEMVKINKPGKSPIERFSAGKYNLSHCCPQDFKDRTEGLIYADYRAISWQLFKHLADGYNGDKPLPKDYRNAFLKLFKYHNIRSILDIGCGPGYFFERIMPLLKEAGITTYGIDLSDQLKDNLRGDVIFHAADATHLKEHFPGMKFDIIFCSGVIGSIQFFRDAFNIFEATSKSERIIEQAVDSFSDHPRAALFVQSFSSYLLLHRSNMERFARVLHWNTDEMHLRGETNERLYTKWQDLYGGKISGDRDKIRELWENGANVAVFAKK